MVKNIITNTNTDTNQHISFEANEPFSKEYQLVCYSHTFGHFVLLRTPIFYYEIEVLPNASSHVIEEMIISIGLTPTKDYPDNKHIGWIGNAIGFHSDDGQLFDNTGSGASFDRPYNSGDVIGVGFNVMKKVVFFTRNGKIVNNKFIPTYCDTMYPALGFSTCYSVSVNFGQQPFVFDILEEIKKAI
ncbi:hypothetical protein EIN_335560 [Entamoeba invadens IP1]|uniref:B30.2/SPRY domain-containing protein n=2 Tax=Entamoeba invadens TaxID=33085 RepID=L7FM30_ENTIV|nr:hypothetical protein EIN_335560 [Entamoeba invadens IP1]ELP88574.1 hypothetical protein EIN_335560 [Entamoeba invadens IP1]|eukprot:XP_004255345.1 hypothetical protein EIN_335560 [Entamoeba invadens IP1]